MLSSKIAASYFRFYAVKCAELSQEPLTDTKNRASLLTMADAWLELAHRAEDGLGIGTAEVQAAKPVWMDRLHLAH